MILRYSISEPLIRDRIKILFNDMDQANVQSLKNMVDSFPGIEKLKYKPQIENSEVNEKVCTEFENIKLIPTFSFVDPWGYKGLSLRLINSVLKDWGCDSVFFFNYSRISMGIMNDAVLPHMEALFGKKRIAELRERLPKENPEKKELIIVENLCNALREYGHRYVLPFRFKSCNSDRISHHLIFVTKHFKGYDIMKSIMADESSDCDEGIGSFEYNPASSMPKQSLLFQLSRPFEDLKGIILDDYRGRTILMKELYQEHSIDKPFTRKNYKDALLQLEKEGKIVTSKHKKNTFSEKVKITFHT
ncbi:hypothetical protein SDC9_150347 [bioreactor metagenome]|uniref:GMT-like wHTH domain-containing protein n=1 Tax=bioreactor metagenome TaxID=1076179 RepID=A0A645ERH2_9ZZZZ